MYCLLLMCTIGQMCRNNRDDMARLSFRFVSINRNNSFRSKVCSQCAFAWRKCQCHACIHTESYYVIYSNKQTDFLVLECNPSHWQREKMTETFDDWNILKHFLSFFVLIIAHHCYRNVAPLKENACLLVWLLCCVVIRLDHFMLPHLIHSTAVFCVS